MAVQNRIVKVQKRNRALVKFDSDRIRYDRVKSLFESVEGFTEKQVSTGDLIPGDAVIREFIGGSVIKIPHNE